MNESSACLLPELDFATFFATLSGTISSKLLGHILSVGLVVRFGLVEVIRVVVGFRLVAGLRHAGGFGHPA